MQFLAILREKTLFWANFGLRAPLGVKTPLSPPDQIPGSAPELSILHAGPRFIQTNKTKQKSLNWPYFELGVQNSTAEIEIGFWKHLE